MKSVIRMIEVLDTSLLDGTGLTGKIHSDFTIKYRLRNGTLISLTPETITTLGTYQAPSANTNIRIKELNSADPTKGIYEVHFHDDQVAPQGEHLELYVSVAGGKCQPYELSLLQSDDDLTGYGIVDTDATTTSVPSSACIPSGAVLNQFIGRVMIFTKKTATAALRGQANIISGSTNLATPTFTFAAAWTTAPASGDTFKIV